MTLLLLLILLFLFGVPNLTLRVLHPVDELVGVHVFVERFVPKRRDGGVLL